MLHEEKYAGQLSSPGLGKKEELVETAQLHAAQA
jgi:hypothetical protein